MNTSVTYVTVTQPSAPCFPNAGLGSNMNPLRSKTSCRLTSLISRNGAPGRSPAAPHGYLVLDQRFQRRSGLELRAPKWVPARGSGAAAHHPPGKTPMTCCLISISGKVSGARTSSHFDLNGQAWSKLCPLLTKSPPKFTIEIMKRTQRHCFPRLVWKNAEQRKMMEHDEANKKRRTGKCAASLVCL